MLFVLNSKEGASRHSFGKSHRPLASKGLSPQSLIFRCVLCVACSGIRIEESQSKTRHRCSGVLGHVHQDLYLFASCPQVVWLTVYVCHDGSTVNPDKNFPTISLPKVAHSSMICWHDQCMRQKDLVARSPIRRRGRSLCPPHMYVHTKVQVVLRRSSLGITPSTERQPYRGRKQPASSRLWNAGGFLACLFCLNGLRCMVDLFGCLAKEDLFACLAKARGG